MASSLFNIRGLLPFLLIGLWTGARADNSRPLDGGFIENKGQIMNQNYETNAEVLYLWSGPGIKIQLRKTGYSYELFSLKDKPETSKTNVCKVNTVNEIEVTSHRVDIDFMGMNANPIVTADEKNVDYFNYYTCGHEATGVASFNKITYKNVYKNTDIEFTLGKNGSAPLKYNIILHPGANIHNIRFLIKGAEKLVLEDNYLSIQTTQGILNEKIPFSYYSDAPDQNKKVDFVLRDHLLSFSAQQDPTRTLIIDPSSNLIWSTYYAGTSLDYGLTTRVDSQKNVYMAGYTLSSGNIATNNTFQSSYAGDIDGYLVKFDQNGVRQWATYIGGTMRDQIFAMDIDKTDAIYITGDTKSATNMTTPGVHQTIYGGGEDDVLLARFDINGLRIWTTYMGGIEHEFGHVVSVDKDGNVVVGGHTTSSNGIASIGAYSTIHNFEEDGFVAKFTNTGQRIWSSYFGDSGYADVVYGVASDSNLEVYIIGETTSLTGMSTANSHQPIFGGGSDAFIARFSADGSTLVWATYYGGSGSDRGTSIRVGKNDIIYLSGNTESSINIATPTGYQPNMTSAEDGFLASFDKNGTRLWATYFGGNATDYINEMILDETGNLVFCGQTLSTNSISTTGAFQSSLNGVNFYDAFFAKWSNQGVPKLGTYFGQPFNENARSIAVDKMGKVYIGGETTSTVGIATATAHQTLGVGSTDAFLAKFCMDIEPVLTPANGSSLCVGPATISALNGYSSYLWNNNSAANPLILSHAVVGTYHYSVYVTDGYGCSGGSVMYTLSVLPCYVSLEEQEQPSSFRLYPIPSSDQLTIDVLSSGSPLQEIRIYHLTGQLLSVNKMMDSSSMVSIKDLPPGIYILEAKLDGQLYYQKFVKE